MTWIFLAIAICICIVILLTMPIEIRLFFERAQAREQGSIELKALFGLIRIRRELSDIRTQWTEEGPTIGVHGGPEGNHSDSSLSTKEVPGALQHVKTFMHFLSQSRPTIRRTFRHVHVDEMTLEAKLGVEDAVFTGISVGFLYAVTEMVLGWLSHRCRFEQPPSVQIRPVFNRMHFEVRTQSIMHLRAGYAISAGIRLLYAWKRRT